MQISFFDISYFFHLNYANFLNQEVLKVYFYLTTLFVLISVQGIQANKIILFMMYMMYPDLSSLQSHLNSTNFTFNFVKINQEKRAVKWRNAQTFTLGKCSLWKKVYIDIEQTIDESTGQTIQKLIIKIDFGINLISISSMNF